MFHCLSMLRMRRWFLHALGFKVKNLKINWKILNLNDINVCNVTWGKRVMVNLTRLVAEL